MDFERFRLSRDGVRAGPGTKLSASLPNQCCCGFNNNNTFTWSGPSGVLAAPDSAPPMGLDYIKKRFHMTMSLEHGPGMASVDGESLETI
jgi:hypothetical protein